MDEKAVACVNASPRKVRHWPMNNTTVMKLLISRGCPKKRIAES
nr:MAG TPA: hypothetical protein [Caudoviricetes sp.]